ncbi:MAG TPA: MarR family transcriptional regulator [Pseudobdellovibrionaceae bacterium]
MKNSKKKNSTKKTTKKESAEITLHPALEKHLGYCLYKAALKFRAMIDHMMVQEKLIAPQFGVLLILREIEGLNQINLGLQMGIDKATIVKLIDGLERAAYVTRVSSETDRREKFLQITPRGRKLLEDLKPRMKDLETEFLKPLDPEEKSILLNAIPKLMKPKREQEKI